MNRDEDFERIKLGDYYCYCDICGCRFWASEATILAPETGRGGLIVCPEDRDPIDYGLVPYTIPAERNVPFARDTVQSANPAVFQPNTTYQYYPTLHEAAQDDVFNWNATPTQLYLDWVGTIVAGQTWDFLILQSWDQWTQAWGT